MIKLLDRYITKAAMTLKRPEDITFGMLKFLPANDTEMEEVTKALGKDLPDGYVAGWASTPDLDLYHHVVKTGAFDDSIKARGLKGPKSIKLLLGHDWDKVAGVILKLETRQKKLWIEAQMNLNISYAKDAYEATKMVGGMNFSVGFMLQDYAFKEDESKNEYLLIERGDLFEVSIVPFPGNEEATMEVVKSRQQIEHSADCKWKISASRDLQLCMKNAWDGGAAKKRLLDAADIGGETPRFAMARKGFLVHDAANADDRASYKLPIADVVDGKVIVMAAGIRAAAARLTQTDLPESVKKEAQKILDYYESFFEKATASDEDYFTLPDEDDEPTPPELAFTTITEFEKALVATGLVKCRNDAKRITLAVKGAPHLFVKEQQSSGVIDPPEPSQTEQLLSAGQMEDLSAAIAKMRSVFAPPVAKP